MNTRTRSILDEILIKCHQYKTTVEAALNDYTQKEAEAIRAAAKFKDEAGYISEARKQLAAETRSRIKVSAERFAKEIRTARDGLQSELKKHLSEPCDSRALSMIKTWKDFQISPSKVEIETALDLLKGNPVGLSALAKVLTEIKSPFVLVFKSTDAFEKDLATISELSDLADGFSPVELHSAACGVYAGQLIQCRKPDGTSYTDGRSWNSLSLTIRRGAFNSAVKAIEAFCDSWVVDCSYQLADRLAIEQRKQIEKEAEEAGEEPEPEYIPPSCTTVDENHTSPIIDNHLKTQAENKAIAEAAAKAYYR